VVPNYAGNLKQEELINWLKSMEMFFKWKSMIEEKKVKFACTKLKGHAMIWWDHVQKDRTKKRKDKIKTWKKMEKRVEKNYAQSIFRRLQNLKQNLSTVEELTNEFYQLSIHVDHQETDEQLAARYVNCLNFLFRMN
jgi:hypothetical protein